VDTKKGAQIEHLEKKKGGKPGKRWRLISSTKGGPKERNGMIGGVCERTQVQKPARARGSEILKKKDKGIKESKKKTRKQRDN